MAKLLILSISLTQNPWPTCLKKEDIVDLVYKKAVEYHDHGSSMGHPLDLTVDHKGARDIVCYRGTYTTSRSDLGCLGIQVLVDLCVLGASRHSLGIAMAHMVATMIGRK